MIVQTIPHIIYQFDFLFIVDVCMVRRFLDARVKLKNKQAHGCSRLFKDMGLFHFEYLADMKAKGHNKEKRI